MHRFWQQQNRASEIISLNIYCKRKFLQCDCTHPFGLARAAPRFQDYALRYMQLPDFQMCCKRCSSLNLRRQQAGEVLSWSVAM